MVDREERVAKKNGSEGMVMRDWKRKGKTESW